MQRLFYMEDFVAGSLKLSQENKDKTHNFQFRNLNLSVYGL